MIEKRQRSRVSTHRRALAKRARGPVWALGGMEEGPLPGSRRRRAESAAAAVEEERVARQAATARCHAALLFAPLHQLLRQGSD